MPGNRLYKYIHKWMDVGLLFLMYYLCVGGHTGALLGGAHSPGLLRVRHCYCCCPYRDVHSYDTHFNHINQFDIERKSADRSTCPGCRLSRTSSRLSTTSWTRCSPSGTLALWMQPNPLLQRVFLMWDVVLGAQAGELWVEAYFIPRSRSVL